MIKLNGNYEELSPEEWKHYHVIFDSYKSGLDTYTLYHFDIEHLDIKLIKLIIIYVIDGYQDVNVGITAEGITSMRLVICGSCLASAYAEYLGHKGFDTS